MVLLRGLAVWAIMVLTEFAHGGVRELSLEPVLGDLRARLTAVLEVR